MNLRYFKEQYKKKIVTNVVTPKAVYKTATKYQLLIYNMVDYTEIITTNFDEIVEAVSKTDDKHIKWLSIFGADTVETYTAIGNLFDIPSYFMLGLMNTTSTRSSIQESEHVVCCNLKTVNTELVANYIEPVPISFCLRKKVLISFQDEDTNFFEKLEQNIKDKVGHIVKRNEDYLFHLLIDEMLQNFYKILDRLEGILEIILTEIKRANTPEILENMHQLKKCFLDTKRVIVPLKEILVLIINSVQSKEYPVFQNVNAVYFKKLQSRLLEIHDQIDEDMVQLDNATNYFFSMQNHKMNEIMKVLTIVSVMFIPLTFLTGIYGMNFSHIPQSENINGFWYMILVMGVLLILMLLYFKQKKWF